MGTPATNCDVTYFDWLCETESVEDAARIMAASRNGDMRCVLETGHCGPHKWLPLEKVAAKFRYWQIKP